MKKVTIFTSDRDQLLSDSKTEHEDRVKATITEWEGKGYSVTRITNVDRVHVREISIPVEGSLATVYFKEPWRIRVVKAVVGFLYHLLGYFIKLLQRTRTKLKGV